MKLLQEIKISNKAFKKFDLEGRGFNIGFEFEFLVPDAHFLYDTDDYTIIKLAKDMHTFQDIEKYFVINHLVHNAHTKDTKISHLDIDEWYEDNFKGAHEFITNFNLVPEDPTYHYEDNEEAIVVIDKEINIFVPTKNSFQQHFSRYFNIHDFYIVPDDSIHGDGVGLELVSRPKSYDTAISLLSKVLNYLRSNKLQTNDSTGLHLNISLSPAEMSNLDVLKLMLFIGDEYSVQKFDRLDNRFTTPVLKKLKALLNRDSGDVYKNLRSGKYDFEIRNFGKYSSVNFDKLASQYLEFRSIGGDYLYKEQEIIEQLNRFCMAVAIACDPDLYKDEYHKKIAKLIQSMDEVPKVDNIENVFAFRMLQQTNVIKQPKLFNEYLSEFLSLISHNDNAISQAYSKIHEIVSSNNKDLTPKNRLMLMKLFKLKL